MLEAPDEDTEALVKELFVRDLKIECPNQGIERATSPLYL